MSLLKIFTSACLLVCFSAPALRAQTPGFLSGKQTGNLVQVGGLLGTGTAGITTPMSAYTSPLGALRYYYGNNILGDNNVTTPTTITSSRVLSVAFVLVAGADAYIQFRNAGNVSLPANTTTYFKMGTAPTVTGLSATVGGLLGLSNVYNITGRGYTGAADYLMGGGFTENNGTAAGTAAGTTTQLLLDSAGKWYAAVTPDSAYNSVRLNVAFSPSLDLVNLSRDLSVNVYNAFYYSTPDSLNCSLATFTTPGEVQGVSLSLASVTPLLGLDSAVYNPWKAIDQSDLTYSRITSGALGIATSVSQTILFNGTGTGTDAVKIKMSLPLSALTAAVLQNVTVKTFNKGQQVGATRSLSDLLSLDVLGLLGDNTPFEINYQPLAKFDRVQISLGNLVNIGANILGGGLRIYNVSRVSQSPVITAQPVGDTICLKNDAVFSATVTGTTLSYSWEYFNGTAWVSAGGTANTLIVSNPPLAISGRRYRVKVSGGYCPSSQATITSSEAQLIINSLPVAPAVTMGQ